MHVEIDKVIKRPILTEKTTKLKENDKYVFEVDIHSSKNDIKNAVEKLFNTKVLDVKTSIVRGKLRKYGRYQGYRPDWKKAIVKLQKGQIIKMLEEIK